MNLIDARGEFTLGACDLLSYARFLLASYSARDSCDYVLTLREVERSAEAARWNAEHCRIVVGGERCELTPDDHQGGRIGHEFKPIGTLNSLHCSGLALDLLIYRDGEVCNDEKLYADLAEYWKKRNPKFRWGGDFSGFKDLGHFSREWKGRQ